MKNKGFMVLYLAALLASPACVAPEESGAFGAITYGPTYPGPCREGMDCADKPYTGSVYAYLEDRQTMISESSTDAEGAYRIKLAPGRYYLSTEKRFISECGAAVEVKADEYVNASFSCDTGIR